MRPRLSADLRRCLVAWVRQEPATQVDSACGRVRVRGRWLYWRTEPIALLGPMETYPARVWLGQHPRHTSVRRKLERAVLQLLPFSQVREVGDD